MKSLFTLMKIKVVAIIAITFFACVQANSQDFQRAYGTPFDNAFGKVIQDGTNYYVLGQDEPSDGVLQRATVTRLDANGMHQWTLSLPIASVWNDAVLIPGGDLVVVGTTTPISQPSQSLIGRVTSSGGGNFSWLKSYDWPGMEAFTHIVKNPMPQNAAFPYYVLGRQRQTGAPQTTDDVVLLNLDANGVFQWKKVFVSAADDQYYRDLEALPNGNMLIVGEEGATGYIFEVDNTGAMQNGVQISNPQLAFVDVTRALTGDIYAVANTVSGQAHLLKFDPTLFLQWDVQIPELGTVSQVWEGFLGEIYVTGRGNFGSTSRDVVVKITDSGAPTVDWVKYPNTGTGFIGGSAWWLNSAQIAFTDARSVPGGFGQNCAFLSVSDPEMATCSISTEMASLAFYDPLPDGPAFLNIEFQDILSPTTLVADSMTWQQQQVCSTDPCCTDSIAFFNTATNVQTNGALGDCFINFVGTGLDDCMQISYLWGDDPLATWTAPVSNNVSVSHTYTGPGSYFVCYRIEEVDANGVVCWDFEKCDSVLVLCACDSSLSIDGLTGYFPFYNNADDLSVTAINGNVIGATPTTGHDGAVNSAYHFNGTTDWIDCGINNRGVTNAVTVGAWVKTGEQVKGQWVVGKYSFPEDRGYGLFINNGIDIGKVGFGGRDGTSGAGAGYSSGWSTTLVNDSAWHCLVGKAANNLWSVYVDGQLESIMPGSTSGAGGMATSANIPLTIGFQIPTSPVWMNGDVDNVVLYNRPLSDEEIACFCNGVLPPDTCKCGNFTDMFIRTVHGAPSIPVSCGGAPVQLGCPQPGGSFMLTGLFHCDGDDCPDVAPVSWTLTGPGGNFNGTTTANPYFGVVLLPTYFTQPGLYTLTLNGQCGNQSCPCIIQFFVDCTDLCSCTPADIQAMQANVNAGFSIVKYATSCKACFAPVALSDCEEVEWHLNSATGAVIGNSIGGNGICHTFPNGGTYTVVMVVTRKKPDGSICEVFVHSKAVTVTCLVLEECTDSDFPNLAFAEGAIGGGMLSGGASAGWQAVSGEPLVIEGAQGSLDAWTILVSGNFDTSAVVGTIDSAFVEKSLVILKMRIRPIGPTGQFRSMACDYVKPKPVNNNNNNDACYRNLHLPLLVLNSSEWADVEMPLDLSALIEIASCDTSGNGVWIQPSLTVTNPFGNNQGGEETYSYLQIDNLCIDGIPVSATGNTKLGHRIRLYPNPTSGGLTLEFKGAVPRAGSIQILDFLGRILRTETLPPGSQAHQISIATLPAGVYFVKVLDGGEQVWAQKVVKQ